ncbi:MULTISPECIES: hypothetical protein [Thalassolituus]|jgi:hypothetical protein|nr:MULTISPECIES: hypothetical protein [Thalassolituus]MEC8908934.1 hypothetical protein [Pseudomonadota bacterium]MEC9256471.1 hypothetical protein [Pseudomonadota bacterium]MED5440461.1 hypothetical protein [Pseudomonadota bacterium]MEE3191313.1 hypothetical protein [Pseudomonadota bacterium]MEE3208847.1 hypothetical protein [Pseudomonadota bacterium]
MLFTYAVLSGVIIVGGLLTCALRQSKDSRGRILAVYPIRKR